MGLVNNGEFKGWDPMFELIEQRRGQGPAERERLEWLCLVERDRADKKKRKNEDAELNIAARWLSGTR
jgi:hypothetical protein